MMIETPINRSVKLLKNKLSPDSSASTCRTESISPLDQTSNNLLGVRATKMIIQTPVPLKSWKNPLDQGARNTPKSESIPIRKERRGDTSSLNNSAEQVYDFATWRMYHRIATARAMREEEQQRQERKQGSSCLKRTKGCSSIRSKSILKPMSIISPDLQSETPSQDEPPLLDEPPPLDGEIFDLDI
mmetsp:Transcript_13861/g.21125  ORF Transcript_13861/g.21125 Transcript_13861/m.21125 type:complete len:187 (+) Transcript_13861:119-679(+)